jgi:hypothetical protein
MSCETLHHALLSIFLSCHLSSIQSPNIHKYKYKIITDIHIFRDIPYNTDLCQKNYMTPHYYLYVSKIENFLFGYIFTE